MAKKVGVVLSGCGKMDGSEVHEAVCALLAIDRAGAEYVCVAPDVQQVKVVDHGTGEEMDETRNARVEAARIARGPVTDIAEVKGSQFDAWVFPGGFGAVLNLSNFATAGAEAKPHPEVARVVTEAWEAGKPICAICIAPATIAAIFRDRKLPVTLTIGNDTGTVGAIETMGCKHETCSVTEFAVDEKNRIVSTPAYMLGQRIGDVAEGIARAVNKTLELADAAPSKAASAAD